MISCPAMARLAPMLLLLVLYWPGLTNWFYQDDFGWLRLRQEVQSARDLGPALFAPKAHGNMRPLGENAYWLGLSGLFGARALPFRICAFLTQIAALVLLGQVLFRLTKSTSAAVWAQILWIANCNLAPVMGWNSIYNQALSGFFFLLAFWFLLRGNQWMHWAAFLLGLGALETNVVYPAIAACYALLYDRTLLRKITPMFLVSALYVWVHFHFAGFQTGVYAMHLDPGMARTFVTYWSMALGRSPLALTLALTTAAFAFAGWRAAARDYLPAFGLAWFAIVLAPYLPLRDHVTDYYLAVPAIGIAIVGATAAIRAPRVAAAAGIAAYLAMSLPAGWASTHWIHERSQSAEDFVMGVEEAQRHDPGKIILLAGIGTDLFGAAIADVAFLALNIPYVYLVPGAEASIQAPVDLVSKFELPQGMALDAVNGGRAMVYRMEDGVLRNETARYRAMAGSLWKPGPPRFLNLGDPVFEPYLGPGWDRAANGYRALSSTASLKMGGGRCLYAGVFRTDRFPLRIEINGEDAPVELVRRDNELSLFRVTLPKATEWIDVTIRAGSPVLFGYLEAR
jgi:hypothetical protein